MLFQCTGIFVCLFVALQFHLEYIQDLDLVENIALLPTKIWNCNYTLIIMFGCIIWKIQIITESRMKAWHLLEAAVLCRSKLRCLISMHSVQKKRACYEGEELKQQKCSNNIFTWGGDLFKKDELTHSWAFNFLAFSCFSFSFPILPHAPKKAN